VIRRIGTFALDLTVICGINASHKYLDLPPDIAIALAFGWGLLSMIIYIELGKRERELYQ
jgi:hypothetical protein